MHSMWTEDKVVNYASFLIKNGYNNNNIFDKIYNIS